MSPLEQALITTWALGVALYGTRMPKKLKDAWNKSSPPVEREAEEQGVHVIVAIFMAATVLLWPAMLVLSAFRKPRKG